MIWLWLWLSVIVAVDLAALWYDDGYDTLVFKGCKTDYKQELFVCSELT